MGLPQELALALLEEIPEGIAVLDSGEARWPVVFVNRSFERLRGEPREALLQLDLAGLLRHAEDPVALDELQALMARGETVTVRSRAEHAGGGPRLAEIRFQPLRDATGTVRHYVSYHHALPPDAPPPPEARPVQRDDRLTGLCHAEYFRDLYRRDFSIASREGRLLTLFVVDVDCLGIYNETFGMQAGDSLIRRIARALHSALRRGSDLVARLEGGRFVALATGMTPEQAQRHGETLAARVRELHVHHPRSRVARFVTVSVGVAHCTPGPGMSSAVLVDAALQALEQARQDGCNRVALRDANG
ncbi:MAG: diguanylate cyclase [Steroidobacteraceae bacterium]|jgi:diguanylate cyclase (GGDEF)-like protein/PAS domain S-box-containing protein|nr:diguanylate cyclase [Steroidobacteraceae bacterium]